MDDYPTEYYPCTIERTGNKVVERHLVSHSRNAILLFFTDQTYIAIGTNEIDGHIGFLSKLAILGRFGAEALCEAHFVDHTLIDAWCNARAQQQHEQDRNARWAIYEKLKKEFGE